MAATYRRVPPTVWTDPTLTGPHVRSLYVLLLTQPDITAAGIVPLLAGRWANMLELEPDDITTALDVLIEVGKVVIDEVTSEVLLVEFASIDEGASSPNGCKHLTRKIDTILSARLAERALDEAIKVAPESLHGLLRRAREPEPEAHPGGSTEAPSQAPAEPPAQGDALPLALSLSLAPSLATHTPDPSDTPEEPPVNDEPLPLAALAVHDQPDLCSMPTFEEFWQRYPRKVGRRHAVTAYTRAVRRSSHGQILAGLEAHLGPWSTIDRQYVPHAATWLNRDGWLDEPPTRASASSRGERRDRLVAHVAGLGRNTEGAAAVSAMFAPRGLPTGGAS